MAYFHGGEGGCDPRLGVLEHLDRFQLAHVLQAHRFQHGGRGIDSDTIAIYGAMQSLHLLRLGHFSQYHQDRAILLHPLEVRFWLQVQLAMLDQLDAASLRRAVRAMQNRMARVRRMQDTDGGLATLRAVLADRISAAPRFRVGSVAPGAGFLPEAVFHWSFQAWEAEVHQRLHSLAHLGLTADPDGRGPEAVLPAALADSLAAITALVAYVYRATSVTLRT